MKTSSSDKKLNAKQIVYQQAKCLVDSEKIHQALIELSKKMNQDLQHLNPVLLIIMTGGVVFAGQLLSRLNFPLEVDFCQVSRYRDGTQAAELKWIVQPKTNLENRVVVLLDDIYDEGTTLLELIRDCKNRGASAVKTCALVNKLHDRKQDPTYQLDFVALEMPDRFLVGYGMDYEGYGRNLPGIYAID